MIPTLTGLSLWHVILPALGTAFGYWLNNRKPATLADVVPPAHLSTVERLIAAAENDPTVSAVVKLVVQRFESMLEVEAHNALQTVAAPVAVPSSPAVTTAAK